MIRVVIELDGGAGSREALRCAYAIALTAGCEIEVLGLGADVPVAARLEHLQAQVADALGSRACDYVVGHRVLGSIHDTAMLAQVGPADLVLLSAGVSDWSSGADPGGFGPAAAARASAGWANGVDALSGPPTGGS